MEPGFTAQGIKRDIRGKSRIITTDVLVIHKINNFKKILKKIKQNIDFFNLQVYNVAIGDLQSETAAQTGDSQTC